MPVFNGEVYLKEAIESILHQTFTNFEFIIINDGSTDRTEDIILSYKDKRIKYIKNKENLKIVRTLNKGIAVSKGAYIARMDADDISMPDRFARQVDYMESFPKIDVCGCYTKVIGGIPYCQKFPIDSDSIKAALIFYTSLPHPALMIRSTFFKNKKYDEGFQNAEDYRLWSLGIKDSHYHNIPDVLLHYRRHKKQVSEQYKVKQQELTKKITESLLNELGFLFNREELILHNAICSGQCVDVDDAVLWLSKLSKNNTYFDQNVFSTQLTQVLWKVLNNASPKGIRTYFKYLELKKEYNFNISLGQRAMFFLRLSMKWKRC